MSDVISFSSRRPIEVEKAEAVAVAAVEAEVKKKQIAEHQVALLETLDQIRGLVEAGRLEAFVLLGRDPATGLFLTEMALDVNVVPREALFSYLGCMETMRFELADIAALAPVISTGGDVIDAWGQYVQELEEEEDE